MTDFELCRVIDFICHNAGEFPNKKGAAEAAPFLSCLLQEFCLGFGLSQPTPNPSRLREGNSGLILQESWHMVGVAPAFVFAF